MNIKDFYSTENIVIEFQKPFNVCGKTVATDNVSILFSPQEKKYKSLTDEKSRSLAEAGFNEIKKKNPGKTISITLPKMFVDGDYYRFEEGEYVNIFGVSVYANVLKKILFSPGLLVSSCKETHRIYFTAGTKKEFSGVIMGCKVNMNEQL